MTTTTIIEEVTSTNTAGRGKSLLLAALVLLLAVYAPTGIWMWERWTMSVWHNAHGLMLFVFVVYLIWDELRIHKELPVNPSPWGFAVLVPALFIHIFDTGMNTQLLSAFSLIMTLPGLALLFLGKEKTRLILFPLIFLFLTLPIPLAFTGPLHLVLRKLATTASTYLVPLFGIPLYSEGTTLHIPNGTLQVADACSGFSTLYATVAIALLVAYFCKDNKRRMLVLLLAAPIAIGANIIRVVFLTLLVSWQGIDILGTHWHTTSGMFTFALALPLVFWLGNEPAKKED